MSRSRKCPHRVSRKSNSSKRSITRSKSSTGFSTVARSSEVRAPFELVENCIRESVLMQFIYKCRFCDSRRLEGRTLALMAGEPMALGYRRCLDCGKVQEPSISKLLGLVKGGIR